VLLSFAVCGGVFRTDLSLRAFPRLFFMDNLARVANRKARWVAMLRAARNGALLDRPHYQAAWHPHKVYQAPIPDALQSSYKDVEKELRKMSGVPDKPGGLPGELAGEQILFVAGDGLALMRLNHLLANKPDQFIHQTPIIIPIQGSYRSQPPPARARHGTHAHTTTTRILRGDICSICFLSSSRARA